MNSRSTQRRIVDDPAPTGELVAPLSGPSYGPFNVARQRWRKPLDAVLADAIANCRAVTACLQRGMYAPDYEDEPRCKAIFDTLSQCTRQQPEALEAFAEIDWRE
jgi:hypothetical protein